MRVTNVIEVTHDVPGLSMRSTGPGITEYEVRGLASTGGAAEDRGPRSTAYLHQIETRHVVCDYGSRLQPM